MKRRSTIAALLLSTTVYAQAQTTLPLVKDIPVGDGLGANKIDIVGIQFGETRENALAILRKTYPAAKPEPEGVKIGLGDQRGNNVSFDYYYRETLSHSDADTRETIALDFTTPLTGGRVYGVGRLITYSGNKLGNLADLRASIRQKYGEPTVVERAEHQNRIDIIYTYEKRPVRRFGEYDIRTGPDARRENDCLNIAARRLVSSDIKLTPQARLDPCVATIKFTIFLGKTVQTFYQLRVEAVDYNRGVADAKLLDTTLKQALDAKVKSVVGTGSPRL